MGTKWNAVYLRKSSIANSEEMRKFERQRTELIELVEKLDAPYEIYNDEEASSRNEFRPEYVRMKEDIEEGKIKAVYIIEESRLGRDMQEALGFYKLLKQKKVKLISSLHGEINLTDKTSQMVAKIKMVFNEFVYDDTVEKIERGKFRSIKAGVFAGNIPLGYSRGKDKRLVPNEESRLVVKCFHMYKNGYTTRQIQDKMQEETGMKWNSNKVSRILRNDTYIGRIEYTSSFLEETVSNDNAHPPLVDKELFYKVQEILTQRNKKLNVVGVDGKTTYERTREGKTISANLNPLHRLVYCRGCGYRRNTSTAVGRKEIHYSKCKNCGNSGINVKILYNHLLRDIENMILELQELLHSLQDDEDITNKFDDRLSEVIGRLSEIEEERKGLIRLVIKKHISEEESDLMLHDLNQEKDKLESEKAELEEITQGKTTEDKVFDIEDTISKLESILNGTIESKEVNRILRGLIEGVYFQRVTEMKIPSIYTVWMI
ncbi:recombinase family protein [Cytobacillus oceanisediminis]|uniref:recombinase family protein n=1 Tax=Cytobacillus oceanisediminis TaxID=665099 RepID=UPI0023DBDFC6|nr:recombinase family protein [Cytobacillus oceanisediminis]MDF2036569.1 recombinase family protein [Cytobacillus oceanisediminis]